jgi:hypothetical protein
VNQTLAIGLSIIIVFAITLLIGKKFRISSRYERTPHIQDPWISLDKGIDPSEETSEERNA